MKKLRVALILLLAMLVSVALFACGGKKKPKPDDEDNNNTDETKTIRTVGLADQSGREVTSLSFTDVAGETEWQAELDKLTVTVVYKTSGNAKLSVSDCTVSGKISWGTVGNYSVTIMPKENNSNDASATLAVVIDHDFHLKPGSEDTEICSKDGATRITKDLDVELKWKGFHVADNYDFTKKDATSSIKDFGTIQTASGEEKVRTTTVGRLEKGMTITLYGTAQNANNQDKTYYFPILGFADTAYNGPFAAYSGGTGIFIRNEGWVLRNGVGTPRLLAGLVGGSDDSENYGSHPSDLGWHPDDWDDSTNGYGPSNYEDWQPWHVYSHGTVSWSEDYKDVQNVKFSWSYYDIDQEGYGFITVTFYILNANGGITSSLVCTCKVPDSDNGYYDSILHGEFVNMTFSKIETVQTRTLTNVKFNGLKSGAKADYLENELLDFSTLNVTAEYEQNLGTWEQDTQFDVQTKVTVGNKEEWVSLRYRPLTADMKEFKIVRTVGGGTKEAEVPADFITIHKNAVNVVYGYEFEGYKTNGTIGEIPVVSKTDDNGTYVSLTLQSTVAASSYGENSKFVSLRLYAREGATQFDPAQTPVVKSGDTTLTSNDYQLTTAQNGAYVDLIIFVKGNDNAAKILSDGVTISNLVNKGADVKVNLSAINGTESVSEIVAAQTETVYLEKGGKVTIKYHIAEAYWIPESLRYATIDVNGDNSNLGRNFLTSGFTGTIGGVQVSATANETDKTITVVYNVPKVSVTNVLSYKLQLDMWNAKDEAVTQAIDTVYYDLISHADNTVGVWDNEIQAYLEANGAKIYLVQVFKNTKLSDGLIKSGGSLNLSINTGTKDTVNYLDLGYTYKNGAFVFTNSTVSGIAKGTLTTFGTVGNDYDYDYGAVAVIEIDLSKLPTLGLDAEKAYYFEINGAKEPTYIYKVDESVLTQVTGADLVLGATENLTADGTCLSTGYSGKAYAVESETVFYAAVTPSKGNHSVRDGVCETCGASIKEAEAPTYWFGDVYKVNGMLAEGSFLEFIGTFSEDETEALGTGKDDYYGHSIVLDAPNGTYHYVLSSVGDVVKFSGGTYGWDGAADPKVDTSDWEDPDSYTGTVEELYNPLITEKHPYNTINGCTNANGEEISAELYNESRVGGTYRYTLVRETGSNVLSVRFRIWKQGVDIVTGTPFVDFTFELTNVTYDSVQLMGSGKTSESKYFTNTTLTVISGSYALLGHEHDFGSDGNAYRCSLCNALNPDHQHVYDSTTDTCGCGVFNPNHNHDNFLDANNVCTADNAIKYTTTVGDKTYTGYAEQIADFAILDKSASWTPTGYSTEFSVKEDFYVRYNWDDNRDPNWYQDAWIEFYSGNNYFTATNMIGSAKWGTLNKPFTATVKVDDGEAQTLSVTAEMDTAASILPAPQGDDANGYWKGNYTIEITRIGNTLTILHTFVSDAHTVVVTHVYENFTSSDLRARIAGNPFWLDNAKAWSCSLTRLGGEDTETPAE